mmetsp:Transcript_28576/g.27562  ORF Transcript_28576/g.27562 Transcript_28576/m.27562 type:complete len:165 (+) Transcript_28576:1241-1735(+)
MIPISLYVIIEMLKLGQGILINSDVKMYCEEDNNFARCRNSDLIEELGQVELIFSDKTGTLTQNKMEFKKCSVGGKIYGNKEKGEEENPGMCLSSEAKVTDLLSRYLMKERMSYEEQAEALKLDHFFDLLSICHMVVSSIDPKTNNLHYSAASPDELALTNGAA